MTRYVAFLRGINVGGHRVTMDQLRAHFADLGFTGVTTFIASGNVIFERRATTPAALERMIEKHLATALGYATGTFVRTLPELTAIVNFRAFPAARDNAPEFSRYIFFLRAAADPALTAALEKLNSSMDELRAHGREIHWLCRGKISQDGTAWKPLDKLLRAARVDCTSRNLRTVEQIVAQFSGAGNAAGPARVIRDGKSPRGRPRKA